MGVAVPGGQRWSVRHSSRTWWWLLLSLLGPAGCGRFGYDLLDVWTGGPEDASPGSAGGSGGSEASVGDTGGSAWGDGAAGAGAGGSDASAGGGTGGSAEVGGSAGAGGVSEASADGTGASAGVGGVDAGGDAVPTPSCSDGIQNGDETAIDCGGSCAPCGVNTPPVAVIAVTPGLGYWDTATPTSFQANATGSRDREDPATALTYAWDWENDGVFAPADVGAVPPPHTYAAAGTYDVVLRVTDTGGLSSYATFQVIVVSFGNLLVVTTALDENDANATPAAPGGAGFSLREAINYANATAGRQSIFVPSGYAINLTGTLPQPTDAAGMDVIGDGVLLDGAATGGATDCIKLNASNNRYFGFEIRNCPSNPIQVDGGSGNQFARCYIHDNANGVVINGSNNTFGPYNDVGNNGARGIEVNGLTTVSWNRVHGHTGQGIFLAGAADGSLLLGNVVYDNGIGIELSNMSSGNIVVQNTVHASGTNGVLLGSNVNGTVLRNNIISGSGGAGLAAGDGSFAAIDHNDFFGNVGDCSNCTTLGPGSRTDDPKYIDAAARDLRLAPGSLLIDAGVVLGYDVNGPAAGNYNGSAPDMGACEAP